MRPLTPLCELAKKYSTDKGGRHDSYNFQENKGTHEYTPSYWDLFCNRRQEVTSLLEIGVCAGGSLRMWEEFFPNAEIIGVDIDRNTLFDAGRIKCFQADATDRHAVHNVLHLAQAHPFDIIIDDGSHQREHQSASMEILAPHLKMNGLYIIEDIARNDPEWHTYLFDRVPENMSYGLMVPEFKGTGDINDEVLLVARRDT